MQIALEHRDQSCLSAGSPLRRVNLIISISLSFVALMWFARCFTYCSVSTSALAADLARKRFSPFVVYSPPGAEERVPAHTHTYPIFP